MTQANPPGMSFSVKSHGGGWGAGRLLTICCTKTQTSSHSPLNWSMEQQLAPCRPVNPSPAPFCVNCQSAFAGAVKGFCRGSGGGSRTCAGTSTPLLAPAILGLLSFLIWQEGSAHGWREHGIHMEVYLRLFFKERGN